MCWYAVIQDFQELIVGVVGFGGVIVTLLVSAWLSRKQTADARQHEATTLGRGVLAELSHLAAVIEGMAEAKLEPAPANNPTYFPVLQSPVFSANAGNIGKLPQECVPLIITAYNHIESLMDHVDLYAKGGGRRMIEIPQGNAAAVQEDFKGAGPHLKAAIDSLTTAVAPDQK